MNSLRNFALAGLAFLSLAACSDDALEDANAARVVVFNDSPVVVSDVRVTTAEGSEFVVPVIQPGATSREYSVSAVHEYPMIFLTANGKSLGAHPVEGFVPGFNRLLPSGSYTIRIQPNSAEGTLGVSVSQISPD